MLWDHRRHFACPLAFGLVNLLHDGRIHSRSPGHSDRGGIDQCHSGVERSYRDLGWFSVAGPCQEGDEMSAIKIVAIMLIAVFLVAHPRQHAKYRRVYR